MPIRAQEGASLPKSSAELLLMDVFDALERNAICWSTLPSRSPRRGLWHSLDLLVAKPELKEAGQVLIGLGFLPETGMGEPANPCFLTYVPAADDWIRLRLVSRLTFDLYDAVESEGVTQMLTRRVKAGKVAELDPADAFWIVLLNCVVDGVLGDEDVKRLQHLASSARRDELYARLSPRIGHPEKEAVISSAQSGDRATLERLTRDLRTEAEARHSIVVERGKTARRIKRSLRFVPVRGQGLTIALLAPDGAGKSSVASVLSHSLPIPVRVVYMGRARTTHRGRRGSAASGLLRQWRRYLTARYHRFRGRLVLFDRYTYDALLPPRNPKPARVARRWLFAHAIPPPDLAVLLDAPAELMFQRKDEHPQEFLEQRRRDYLELKSRLPEMVVVDASQSLEDVRRDVTHAIWTAYSQEHGKRAAHVPSPAAQGH